MNEIDTAISIFHAIGLEESNAKASLLERVDTKYALNLDALPSLLHACKEHYDVLEINGKRMLKYETTYFDTNTLCYYQSHHAGHGNRLKIRFRKYEDDANCYLEVKHKNNKGITQKTRAAYPDQLHVSSKLKDPTFIRQQHLIKNNLRQTILIRYMRITLVSKTMQERVTIDCNINFSIAKTQVSMPDYAVAEVKLAKKGPSHFTQLMKLKNIREGGISKYCLGVIGLYKDAKKNRFKPFLHRLNNQHINYGTSSSFV